MFSLLIVVLLVTFNTASIFAHESKGILLDLSNSSFSEFQRSLKHYDVMLVVFTFTREAWRLLKSDLAEVVTNFNHIEPKIPIARFDCSSDNGYTVCFEYNIAVNPTLCLIRYGIIDRVFHLSKDSKTITNWLNENSKIVSRRFWSYKELNHACKKFDDATVVAIFPNISDDLVEIYHHASYEITRKSFPNEIAFFHIFQNDVDIANDDNSKQLDDLSELGFRAGRVHSTPAIILRRPKWLMTPLESSVVLYETSSGEDLVEWIKRKAFGTIGWLARTNADSFKLPLIIAYYDYNFYNRPEFSHKWRNQVILASRRHADINFAIASSLDFRNKLKQLGVRVPRKKDVPVFMATDSFGSIFVMRESFSEDGLNRFIYYFSSGLIAPISASYDDNKRITNPHGKEIALTREITGNSFHRFVTHSSKDILILFHDPKCKFSQDFEPCWHELAYELSGEPDLELISMDGSVNTIPSQFAIKKYPTICIVPSETKKMIQYTGGKALHSLIQFVAKHASSELINFRRDGSRRLKQIEASRKTEL